MTTTTKPAAQTMSDLAPAIEALAAERDVADIVREIAAIAYAAGPDAGVLGPLPALLQSAEHELVAQRANARDAFDGDKAELAEVMDLLDHVEDAIEKARRLVRRLTGE